MAPPEPALAEALTAAGLLVLGGVVPIPRPVVCIGAGAALGWAALVPTMAGSALGSALGFALARCALRGPLLRLVARHPGAGRLLAAVEGEGWRVLALLRLASPVPGPAINAACGASAMGFSLYMATTVVALLPQTVLYVAVGLAGEDALLDPSRFGLHGTVAAAGLALTGVALWRLRVAAGRRLTGPRADAAP